MNRIDIPSVDVRVRWQPPLRCSSHTIGSRLPAFLLLALVVFHLTGCGSSGNSSSFGYAERPPTNRSALAAWQEWTRFGRSTVVYGGHANGYANRNGVDERSEPLTSRVGSYWASCGHPEWNGRTSGRPWSGAFVSWVMTQSGVSHSAFPPAGRHGQYLATLYDHQRSSRSPAFALHAPNEYAPKPVDVEAPRRHVGLDLEIEEEQRHADADQPAAHDHGQGHDPEALDLRSRIELSRRRHGQPLSCIKEATRSAIMMVGAFVLPPIS